MATVPVQTTPSVDLQVGQAPLFSATNIQPVQDTGVAQDIERLSNAQKQFAQIAVKLQDEQNDVKAGEAYQGYQTEADEKVNAYLTTQGSAAIATVETGEDGETITEYDKLVKDLDEIAGRYREGLDNSDQIDIFNNKYSASKRIAVNQASKHSIKQQRLAVKQETLAEIELAKKGAIANYQNWNVDDGDFNTFLGVGIANIKRNAELQNQNTDPTKGPLSSQYILELQKFNQEINEAVLDNLVKDGEHKLAAEFLKSKKQQAEKNIVTPLEEKLNKKWGQYNCEQCTNGVIKDNTNQNSGNFLDQVNTLMSLKSSHYIDDGTGASVKDSHHSDKVNIAGQTQADNINTLELIKNESKFYKLDSKSTLINEHQLTHLFAVQHLGVKKADALYTKAKTRTMEFNEKDKKNMKIQTQEINEENKNDAKIVLFNKKIIENYNKLIAEEANKIYGRFGKGDFAVAIANDLEIIESGINYDDNTENTKDINFVTGLQPINNLKEKIKNTVTDPEQQKFAIKDLEIKYNKIKNERENIYNQALNNAKEIAFAEKGGWKNLANNGIDIDNFSESDQTILKNGHPTKSDKDTVILLKENPIQIRDNLDNYSQALARADYLALKKYANDLKGEDKVIAATIDNKLLNLVLKQKGFDDIRNKKNDEAKDDYLEIEVEWTNRIDEEQKATNKKLDRTKKKELLEEILTNKVIYDQGFFQSDYEKPLFTVDNDQMENIYVKVNGESIWLKTINAYQRKKIMNTLEKYNLPISSQRIAEYWVKAGRPTADNDIDDINFHKKRKNVNEKIISETSSNNNSYMPYFNLPY